MWCIGDTHGGEYREKSRPQIVCRPPVHRPLFSTTQTSCGEYMRYPQPPARQNVRCLGWNTNEGSRNKACEFAAHGHHLSFVASTFNPRHRWAASRYGYERSLRTELKKCASVFMHVCMYLCRLRIYNTS